MILTVVLVLMIANIMPPLDLSVFAGNTVSHTDAVSSGDLNKPYINRINLVDSPMVPTARGILTHVTANGATITVAELFRQLGVSGDPDDVTGVDCNTRFFDTETGTGGSRIIKTKRSFDTLETVTFQFEDGSTLPVIFKDSLYVTNIAPLCTDMTIQINGKSYSSNSQEDYNEPIPVSGKKTYDLSISFAELPDKQFSDYEQLEFKLPDGFTLPDNFNEMNHTFDIDMALGGRLVNNKITYDKSTNKVYVDWNQNDEKAFNNFRGASTAKFTLVLSGNLDPSFGKLIFSTDKELTLEQENLHNASVTKSAVYAPYQINYEIKVTSDGTTENLMLTDEMGTALQNPGNISFSFADDPVYEPKLLTNENGTFTVRIPKMDDEDVLFIRYISDINVEKIARSANATVEETGNTVRIVGDNDPSDNEAAAWVSAVEFSDIEKNVIATKNVYRNGNPFTDITWQVITNRNAMIKLSGSQLTDVMSEAAMKYSRYSGDGVTVKCYDKNGDLAAVRNIPWEDLGVDVETATTFTYDIPPTDPAYMYVMEYKTSSDIQDLTKQTFVSNTVTGKCGIAEAGQLLNPPYGGKIAVSKKATNVHSNGVTWEVRADIREEALDNNIKLSEAHADDKGNITSLYLLPRNYIPEATAADGTVLQARNCQEALESLEIIGLQQDEKVRVYYYYKDSDVRYYDSDPSMWHDGVLSMSGFVSDPSERWPNNMFYMYFYKDYDMTPGLNHPEDGTERRLITVRLNHSFPVEWVNYARDYINASEVYRPGIFTHTNWVVLNGVKAMDAFNTQPANVYKHVINQGNQTGMNPVCTVRLGNSETGEEIGITYPVYRYCVSVNGIYSNDPIVIDDEFDTSLFKLFDKRDFGDANQIYVEQMDGDTHKLAWVNWVMPQFGANPEITWYGAGGNSYLDDFANESFKGVFYRTDNQNTDPSMNHTTDTFVNGRRVIENDDVKAEETENGLRFTFKNVDKFRKSNGQYYNFYSVDYYLIPRSLEALAEIERRVAAANPPLTNGTVVTNPPTTLATVPFTNTATFRGNSSTAVSYLMHKNDIFPVKKICTRAENETSEYAQLHPKYQFTININPGKIALNEGKEMQVTDTYSSSLAVDFRSVVVKTYPEGREDQVTYDYSGNVGTFVIPDCTHVIITYDARISEAPPEDSDYVPFSNTVDVAGLSAKVSDTSEIKVKSNGEAITPEIFIFKYRTNHMEQGLNGAVFNLYEALTDENGEEVLDANGKKTYIPIKVNGKNFAMTSAYDPDTDKNGQIHLKLDLQEHGFNLLANKYYYIHEESAPEGYIASDVFYQFMIRTDGQVNYSQREYLLGDTLTVRNSPDKVNLNLVKTIKGNVKLTSDDLSLLSFKLEKYNEETKNGRSTATKALSHMPTLLRQTAVRRAKAIRRKQPRKPLSGASDAVNTG